MQIFEFETLYNTKTFGKNLSHKKMDILVAICSMFEKLRWTPASIHNNIYS